MYPKILKLLVFSAFTFFACPTSDDSSPSGRSASLLKLGAMAIADIAVQSGSQKISPEGDSLSACLTTDSINDSDEIEADQRPAV